MHENDDQAQDQLKEVSRLYELMDKLPNSFFPFEIIKIFRKEWQLHLRRISDFLLCGEGIWWSKNEGGITLYDSKDEAESRQEGPPLHHYRSWTLDEEEEYVVNCWKSCLEANISLPEIYDETGQPDDKPPLQVTASSGESKHMSNSSLDSQIPSPTHETDASHTDVAEKDGAALCSLEDDEEILRELNEIDCYDSDTEVAGDSVSEQSEIVPDHELTMTYNSEDTPPFFI